MLKAIKEHARKITEDVFRNKRTSQEWKKVEIEIVRLRRIIVYYQNQQAELKKALGLEYTSNYKELLEMAKDPANHKWKANSELITVLGAALKRSDNQILYFTQDELESANGQGIIADWDAEKNCARIMLIPQ